MLICYYVPRGIICSTTMHLPGLLSCLLASTLLLGGIVRTIKKFLKFLLVFLTLRNHPFADMCRIDKIEILPQHELSTAGIGMSLSVVVLGDVRILPISLILRLVSVLNRTPSCKSFLMLWEFVSSWSFSTCFF